MMEPKDYIRYQKICIQDEKWVDKEHTDLGMKNKRIEYKWVAFLMSYSKDKAGTIHKTAVHRGEPSKTKEAAKRALMNELKEIK